MNVTDITTRRFEKNSLVGFFTVEFDELLTITGNIYRNSSGGLWISWPNYLSQKDNSRKDIVCFNDVDIKKQIDDSIINVFLADYPDILRSTKTETKKKNFSISIGSKINNKQVEKIVQNNEDLIEETVQEEEQVEEEIMPTIGKSVVQFLNKKK